MLSKRELAQLDAIRSFLDAIQNETNSTTRLRRRNSAEKEQMELEVIAERQKGVSAAELAKRYGVTVTYIYMLSSRKKGKRAV